MYGYTCILTHTYINTYACIYMYICIHIHISMHVIVRVISHTCLLTGFRTESGSNYPSPNKEVTPTRAFTKDRDRTRAYTMHQTIH